MKDFNGKTAVVTGAASGIGNALSLAFAARGAKVVLADVEANALEAVRADVEAAGTEAIAVPTDVTDEGRYRRWQMRPGIVLARSTWFATMRAS